MSDVIHTVVENSIKTIMEDFTDIKKNARIDDEKFEVGVKFAVLISEGRDKTSAYMSAFGESDRTRACVLANKFIRTKWVSDLVNRLITGNHVIFADKHYQALEEMYDIGMDKGISPKVRVDALKAFVECTKRPEAKVDTQINISLGAEMTEKLEQQLALLAQNSKMITHSGEIIDVEMMK